MYLYKDGMIAYADKNQLEAMLADGWSPDKPSEEIIEDEIVDDEIVDDEIVDEVSEGEDDGNLEAATVVPKTISRKKK